MKNYTVIFTERFNDRIEDDVKQYVTFATMEAAKEHIRCLLKNSKFYNVKIKEMFLNSQSATL